MAKFITNNAKYDRLYNQYIGDIETWDWESIKQSALNNVEIDCDDNKIGCEFLGTVFALAPSGKYYTPFANSNATKHEALQDEAFYEALDKIADDNGMFIFNGEGDPCDVFAGINVE